jgi:inorganic pyrophosphatase
MDMLDSMSTKEVLVQIEIGSGQNVKYEVDHQTHRILCDRFLHGPFVYPFNYGYITHTMGGDGDPLDVVVLCEPSLHPTCFITCRIIGALITRDEKGRDEKILAVPIASIDPSQQGIQEYTDLDKNTLGKIKYFFQHYKDMEPNKFVVVEDFVSSEEAYRIYQASAFSI